MKLASHWFAGWLDGSSDVQPRSTRPIGNMTIRITEILPLRGRS